jgi:CRISPR-associated endonuclease Csn1
LFTDKNILKDKIKENYSNLFNSEEIIKMTSFKYTGWGRFSKKFLTSIKTNENYVNKQTGQTKLSIIDLLKYTNFNLMEIINNSDLGIKQQLDNFAMKQIKENITYKDIEELYCSPSVKKQIWQTVLIAKELKKTLKTSPNKVFIEMARAEGTKNRTLSRRKRLEAIYNEALKMHSEYKKELTETKEQLQNIKDDKFKIKKLYHYFMQMGKCVYTNNPIDLDDLMNDKYNKMYNIDHIYPQSKIKDDSITNTVLVDQTANARKADVYPINLEIQNKCKNGIWLTLKKCGLFSNEKYARLIRKTKLTAEEKMKFVERQLVETRQTTKEVAKLLKSIFPNSKIVYSKSENIGLFKQNFAPPTKKSIELGKINKNKVWDYGLVKCREVNDLHHAKDAYLNIVVGNVYDTKFSKYFYTNKTNSKDYKNYNAFGTREERLEHFSKLKYHIKNMYDYNVEGAWVKDDNQTISSVIRNINKNNILFTKESQFKKGELWAQNASKKEKNLIPIKKQLSNTLKYGGYKSVKASHFAVIEYENNKGVKETKFETVPIYLTNKVKKDNQVLIDYFKNKLQAKNVKVIMDKIKIGSVIELDGAPFIVTGNNDNVVLGCVASQLIFPKELVAYIKKLVKFKSKVEYVKKLKKQISITDSDEISKSENLELYNLFIEKLNKKQYANIIRPLLKENLIKLKDKFINLPIEEQAVCLINILPAFQANASSANLKLLGKGDNVAKVQPGKKSMYEDYKSIKVIDYSITGLFKKERKIK